jgi:hypothetical protein
MDKQPDTVQLEHEGIGSNKCRVTARWRGELLHMDTLDLASAFRRKQFAHELKKKCPGLSEDCVEAELLRLVTGAVSKTPGDATGAIDGQDNAELLSQMPPDVVQEAEAMLADSHLIQRIIDDVDALGVAGERELTATIYLIGISRLLDRPLSAIVQGPSSSGKSYMIEKVASLFPPEAVIHATQMTPQALFHMKPGSLSHRFVVAGERSRIEDDERAEATRALREMISSGKLSKLMPTKVGGLIETVQIKQDGPIAYVESTTLARVFDEDANRSLLLHTDERPEQTRRIVNTLANAFSGAHSGVPIDRIIQVHYALQRLLRQQAVVIPFAERIGELFTGVKVEVRRAFPHLMRMIQAITLLHQRQRETDDDGRLVAIAEDYQLARHLLARPMAKLLGEGISDPARRFYERLETWVDTEATFTTAEVKKHESNCKSSVYGWLQELHDAGVVELIEERRGSRPAKWRLTGHPPDDSANAVLPTVADVFPQLSWQPELATASQANEGVCAGLPWKRGHNP